MNTNYLDVDKHGTCLPRKPFSIQRLVLHLNIQGLLPKALSKIEFLPSDLSVPKISHFSLMDKFKKTHPMVLDRVFSCDIKATILVYQDKQILNIVWFKVHLHGNHFLVSTLWFKTRCLLACIF